MPVTIHEVHRDPTAGLSTSISLCGHDDDADSDIPAGKVRRMFHKVVDSNNLVGLATEVKDFALLVATWAGVMEVWVYVGPIEAAENGPTMQVHPLVWAYVAPIA